MTMNAATQSQGVINDDAYAGKVPGKKPTMNQGGQPAFFSCWDIHAYYGESYIVQGVSFDIREGEIVALLGRNGAGKTSTLRAIARVDDPADPEFDFRNGEPYGELGMVRQTPLCG